MFQDGLVGPESRESGELGFYCDREGFASPLSIVVRDDGASVVSRTV